jgi:hypothetical protein
MSNILVVEPRRLLQHATAIALFPEHEARIIETIPEAGLVAEFDAVIVDAAALRETSALSAQALRAMEVWQAPMVWIDGDPPQAPKRDKLVIVNRPVSRDAMRAALAECLGQDSKPGAGGAAALAQGVRGAARTAREKAAAAPAKERRVIELVDVVEEGPADKQYKGEKKKKK